MRKRMVLASGFVVLAVAAAVILCVIQPRYGEGTKAVIFGDSWTRGYAAEPITRGYAYEVADVLGWDATVDGADGTGYLNPGAGGVGTYAERLSTSPKNPATAILLLQGGINDIGSSQDLDRAPKAIREALAAAAITYPNARVVLVGPAPAELPFGGRLQALDADLQAAASEGGVSYISPLQENWIVEANYFNVIDVKSANHPSSTGHLYLAEKLVASLRNVTVLGFWL